MLQNFLQSPSLQHPSTTIDNFYPLGTMPINALQILSILTSTCFVIISAALNPVSTLHNSMFPSLTRSLIELYLNRICFDLWWKTGFTSFKDDELSRAARHPSFQCPTQSEVARDKSPHCWTPPTQHTRSHTRSPCHHLKHRWSPTDCSTPTDETVPRPCSRCFYLTPVTRIRISHHLDLSPPLK